MQRFDPKGIHPTAPRMLSVVPRWAKEMKKLGTNFYIYTLYRKINTHPLPALVEMAITNSQHQFFFYKQIT